MAGDTLTDWQGNEIESNAKHYYFTYNSMSFKEGLHPMMLCKVSHCLYERTIKGRGLKSTDSITKKNYQEVIRLMEDEEDETVIWLDREPDHRTSDEYDIDPILKALGGKDYV